MGKKQRIKKERAAQKARAESAPKPEAPPSAADGSQGGKLHAIAGRPILHFAIIAAFALIIYSNTFQVPFQWDGDFFIKDNKTIRDFGY